MVKKKFTRTPAEAGPSLPSGPIPTPVNRQRLYLHLVIALAAVLLRIYFVAHAQWYARSDTRNFHEYACNFLSGKEWANFWFEDPRYAGFEYRQYHAPAYPMLLTAIYAISGFDKEAYLKSPMATVMSGAHPWRAVGFNPRYAYAANIAMDMLTMWFLVMLAYHYFNAAAAFGVQLVSALSVMWTPMLISESMFNCMFAWTLWAAATNPEFTNVRRNILFSLAILLAVMTKPIGVVLGGAAVLPLLWRGKWRRLITLAGLGVPVLLYIAFMFWNSHRLYGRAYFMANRGEALAANTYLPEVYVPYEQSYGWLKENLGRIPKDWEVNDRYMEVIKQKFSENPSLMVRNYLRNLTSLFSLKPDWWLEQWTWPATYYFAPEARAWHQRLFKMHYLTYPLGILGLLLLGRRTPTVAWTMVLFVLLHAYATWGHFRYMAPGALILGWYAGVMLSRAPALWRALPQPADGRSAQTKA